MRYDWAQDWCKQPINLPIYINIIIRKTSRFLRLNEKTHIIRSVMVQPAEPSQQNHTNYLLLK